MTLPKERNKGFVTCNVWTLYSLCPLSLSLPLSCVRPLVCRRCGAEKSRMDSQKMRRTTGQYYFGLVGLVKASFNSFFFLLALLLTLYNVHAPQHMSIVALWRIKLIMSSRPNRALYRDESLPLTLRMRTSSSPILAPAPHR